jgi:hypothetical protein
MARLTAEERGSIAMANLAIFFSAYFVYLMYLMVATISTTVGNTLPSGGLQAQQAQQLQTLENSGASALGLSSVTFVVIGAGIIILMVFLLMRFSAGRYEDVYG